MRPLTPLLALRYHTGSLAFGALILAIVQIIRVMLEYLDQRLKGAARRWLALAGGVRAEGRSGIGLLVGEGGVKAMGLWFLLGVRRAEVGSLSD